MEKKFAENRSYGILRSLKHAEMLSDLVAGRSIDAGGRSEAWMLYEPSADSDSTCPEDISLPWI